MENPENQTPETHSPDLHAARQRAAAAAVALALALQPPVQWQAPEAQAHSAWQTTTRAVQLNQSVQRIRGARGQR